MKDAGQSVNKENPRRPQNQREDFSRVVLTGFMGAGKSTIGRLLAARLNWEFLDVDACIEINEGRGANELFAALGEAAFRELEAGTLEHCLSHVNVVVAPGGAAIDLERNRLALAASDDTLVIFLDAPFQTLIERCLREESAVGGTYRPLLHNYDVAQARYASRRLLYATHAGLIIDVSQRSAAEIATQILEAISGSVVRP